MLKVMFVSAELILESSLELLPGLRLEFMFVPKLEAALKPEL